MPTTDADREAAVQAERAAVAWLRERPDQIDAIMGKHFADAIEAGEHRKEG